MANIRLLDPDFEYLFFDEERVQAFIDQGFPSIAPSSIPLFPIQRYDFFAIWQFIDMEVFFSIWMDAGSGLSDLLDAAQFFSLRDSPSVVTCGITTGWIGRLETTHLALQPAIPSLRPSSTTV